MISKALIKTLLAGAFALALPSCAAAEELVLPLISGGSFNLAAGRGKVTVVNFWATWCPPCRVEIPVLNSFYRRHQGQIRMVGVATDPGRDRDKVVAMARGIAYAVGMARDASENSLGAPGSLPVTYVIDGAGEVRARLSSSESGVNPAELEAAVAAAMRR